MNGEAIPLHHGLGFSRLLKRELKVENPLHENLSVGAEVQRARVIDDGVIRVRIQQQGHVAARNTHLDDMREENHAAISIIF